MKIILFLEYLCLMISGALITSTAMAQDVAKGKTIYVKCISCHGTKAEGKKGLKAPKLAGQDDWYLDLSIKAIQNDTRKVPQMKPFVRGLSPQDITDVVAYIKSLPK